MESAPNVPVSESLPSRDQVTALLLESLRNGEPPLTDGGEDTVLLGRNSHFDSLGLVNFIVDVEYALGEKHGLLLTLADERAMSLQRSPFRTVASLTDYICTLAAEQNPG